ncbi:hypothetical protein AABB24_015882 [Solanum stoloniferum]|uniref:Uncharacterized protein n=1 Tax=Solanum stoloniferum TaxID=62892 RepID=A0ABD2TRY7_9SOLN
MVVYVPFRDRKSKLKLHDNEEETEQVVLELFMCVVVLYQGSSFREISDPKMFCHELTDCWTDCRRSNTINWIMKLIRMRITCYLKIFSSLSNLQSRSNCHILC